MLKFIFSIVLASYLASLASFAYADGRVDSCDCSHLEILKAELRNAQRLQQAFHDKIPELRTMNNPTSLNALKAFSEKDAPRKLESIPGNKGPNHFEYENRGSHVYFGAEDKFTNEELCQMDQSSAKSFQDFLQNSACADIGLVAIAHEDVHINFCRSIGYKSYSAMHGADRAQEEVEAYGAEIKVLRATISNLECGFRVDQSYGEGHLSGSICSLSHVFQLQFIATPPGLPAGDMHGVFSFTPGENDGTWSYSGTAVHGIVKNAGNGRYTVERKKGTPPVIQMDAGIVTHMNPMASSSQPGKPATLQLQPAVDACDQRSPDGAQRNPE